MSRVWVGSPDDPVTEPAPLPAAVRLGLVLLGAFALLACSTATPAAALGPEVPRVGPEIRLGDATLITTPGRADVVTGCHEGTRLFLYAGDVELVPGDLSCSGIGPSVGAVPPAGTQS